MCEGTDLYEQKFGYQRARGYTGVTDEQKAVADTAGANAVYYPTNWHNSQYDTWRAKFPVFLRFGGLVPVAPQYLAKNYLGIYPIGQQPTVDDSKPYQLPRLS